MSHLSFLLNEDVSPRDLLETHFQPFHISSKRDFNDTMLELNDFVSDRGGNPNAIKESQRRRFASEEAVDEIVRLYEDARRGRLFSLAPLT